MENLKDIEKKILRRIYHEHETGERSFMLIDDIKQSFNFDATVDDMLNRMKDKKYIYIPEKSSCFKLTDKGKELCQKFFI
jgi:Mn-dependent DtxR family transcriptional regulator